MLNYRMLTALVVLLLIGGMKADTLPFRGGTVFCAEISLTRPEIINLDPASPLPAFAKPVYAALVIQLHADRKLSLFDYSIESFGRRYQCIAIRTDNGPFDGSPSVIEAANYRKYTLLFLLDGQVNGLEKRERYLLCSADTRSKIPPAKVIFVNIGGSRFSLPEAIPLKGCIGEVKK